MLNFIWSGMIGIGIFYGAIQGNLGEITNAALDSAKDAVSLCITMLGVMSFWMGLMEIAAKAGIIKAAAQRMRPFIQFLFPRIPEDHPAKEYITTNFIANILGLGWAATPAGLQAMNALEELEEERGQGRQKGVASNEMCTFLILNISSLQLLPVNIIAYRSQYGSINPASIVGAGIAATFLSTLSGIIYCKIKGV